MKKTTTIIIIVLLIVIVGVVGVYAFMAGKAKDEQQNANLTAVEKVLSRDLSKNYPATVREVVKYYAEILKCYYAEDTRDEDLEALGMKARELYDAELLMNNQVEDYLINLKTNVQQFQSNKLTLASYSVAGSVNADYFQEDGYEFARLSCTYYYMEGGVTRAVDIVYLLRKENKLWKIYGWENAKNLQEQDNAENILVQ